MLYTNATNIDFKNYKRLFVIGCSFTNWMWPTWADIIHKEHSHLAYRNFGTPGCGNDYIFTILNQITREYNLGEKDLVMIMWSSFHRMSVYSGYQSNDDLQKAIINENPATQDNVIRNNTWAWGSGDDMLAQLSLNHDQINCDRGFLIRDLAIIDTITTLMEKSAYSGACMLSAPINKQDIFDASAPGTYNDDVLEFYKHLNEKQLGVPMYDYFNSANEGNFLNNNKKTWQFSDGKLQEDYHPDSINYYNYAKHLGFNFSQDTEQYCKDCDIKIKQNDLVSYFEEDPNWPYDFRNNHLRYPL